jgi:hypothetical protein
MHWPLRAGPNRACGYGGAPHIEGRAGIALREPHFRSLLTIIILAAARSSQAI